MIQTPCWIVTKRSDAGQDKNPEIKIVSGFNAMNSSRVMVTPGLPFRVRRLFRQVPPAASIRFVSIISNHN
ncbi:MAG: hypothetical protein K8S13_02040 [Desulfobacula sp.]|uniref:hypothetical protein n=1 Tax=Desulfobacula sp. TaxID=2593537 RepID=UPI0025BD8840|nr:hypothetical protein [Desulfobacula sp.]MCD4718627.1 hypothetical protein [Desulfobacula sp.]